jgi:hypothetical protein
MTPHLLRHQRILSRVLLFLTWLSKKISQPLPRFSVQPTQVLVNTKINLSILFITALPTQQAASLCLSLRTMSNLWPWVISRVRETRAHFWDKAGRDPHSPNNSPRRRASLRKHQSSRLSLDLQYQRYSQGSRDCHLFWVRLRPALLPTKLRLSKISPLEYPNSRRLLEDLVFRPQTLIMSLRRLQHSQSCRLSWELQKPRQSPTRSRLLKLSQLKRHRFPPLWDNLVHRWLTLRS